jgi:beta-fructofuranosidase
VKYLTGMVGDDNRFRPEVEGVLDRSDTFYAPNCLLDDKGRRILWGWARVKGDGWNGALTVPRVLTLRPDGRLGVTPAPELQGLRGRHFRLVRERATTSDKPVELLQGDGLELQAQLQPTDAAVFALRVRPSAGGDPLDIRFDPKAGQLVAGKVRVPSGLLPDEKHLRLRLVVDRSLAEVYVNDRECATLPLPPAGPDGFVLELLPRPGQFEHLVADVWQLAPPAK